MMNRKALILLMMGSVHAAHIMDSEKVLSFAVASSGITRISVESDRILETFVDPQEGSSAVKNSRGHIYVSGQKQIPHMYLSLITKTGQVQDVKLTFKNMPAKPIVLKQKQMLSVQSDSSEQYLKWLHIFVKGNVPPSFEVKAQTLPPDIRKTPGFMAESVSCWTHPDGFVVKAYNITHDPQEQTPSELKAEAFQQPGDLALVCNARTFVPQTEVKLYVLQKIQTQPSSQQKGDIQ